MDTQGNLSEGKNSFSKKFRNKFLQLFGLTTDPVVRLYNGYGNNDNLIIYGHVFSLSPLPGKRFSRNAFLNLFALLKLFMVKPCPRARVKLYWDGADYEAVSEDDGFFRIEWKPVNPLSPGWHAVQVNLMNPSPGKETILSVAQGHVFVPHTNQFACISDIDDTFLVSHSSNLRKRLYVLLTKHAHSRKPFESVVDHYQLLAKAATSPDQPNPFFYVSSSEWNLYNYILDFSEKHNMPKGIYLLSQVKRLSQVFKTGQNKHATKFMRIARIFESYPHHQYVLLGDDSQEDPNIYASIVEHFPGKVHAVYVRHVHKANLQKVMKTIEKIRAAGVPICHFTHSSEAMIHSKSIGLAN